MSDSEREIRVLLAVIGEQLARIEADVGDMLACADRTLSEIASVPDRMARARPDALHVLR